MDLSKHLEYFNPIENDVTCHVIGVGATGSHVALALAKMGVPDIHIYDFDTVDEHNITNQAYDTSDLGKTKIEAMTSKLIAINPNIKITRHCKGWNEGMLLSGYVFLCVDSIKTRKAICEENMFNKNIKAMFDFRLVLTSAQTYCTIWDTTSNKEKFIDTMSFTDEEAKEQTPVSACGTSLNIITAVWAIVALGLGNFINIVKKEPHKFMTIIDTKEHHIVAIK